MGTNLLSTTMATLVAEHSQPYPRSSSMATALTRAAQVYTGTVTGTTADIEVDTPGDPIMVRIINTTNGCVGEKWVGMAGAYANKLKASDSSQAYADAMITLGTGKFTIGTDADLNTANTLAYVVLI